MIERPVVFSASSVGTYQDCHLRWFFQYVLGEEGEQSEAQRVGIVVHEYAERRLKWTRFSAEANPNAERIMLDADRDGIRVDPAVLDIFDRDILPTYRDPVLIEAPFQIEVNGIPFSGVIDSVDRQDVPFWVESSRPGSSGQFVYLLRDLKTTGKRPPVGRYRFPMIGYWLGARELGHEPDIMQLDYIVRTQKPYYWPEVVYIPDEFDLDWFAATLEAVAEGVERADYDPTGLGTYVCSYCPYKAICGPYQRYKEVTDGG